MSKLKNPIEGGGCPHRARRGGRGGGAPLPGLAPAAGRGPPGLQQTRALLRRRLHRGGLDRRALGISIQLNPKDGTTKNLTLQMSENDSFILPSL